MSLNPLSEKEFHEFGPFRLDLRARLLFRDGVPVPLAPKSFETLVFLVRNGGRVVTREELRDAVWPDVVVSDGSLTQAVFLLRRALGEAEDGPRFVETVPRVGYRFVSAPAEEPAPGGPRSGEAVVSAPRAGGRRRAVAFAATVVVAALASLVFLAPRGPDTRVTRTVAAPRLLAAGRELAIPPDAERLAGRAEGSWVLAAPGAFYLLPVDGSGPPARVPIAPGAIVGEGVVDGRLAYLAGDRVVTRDPLRSAPEESLVLPAGVRGAPGDRLLVSRSGRFVAIRGPAALTVLERVPGGLDVRARVEVPRRDPEGVCLTDTRAAIASSATERLRVVAIPSGAVLRDVALGEMQPFAVAVEDATDRAAVVGAFDAVLLFGPTGGPPVRVPRRGWSHGVAFVPDWPTLVVSGFAGSAAIRGGAVAADETAGAAGDVSLDSRGPVVFSRRTGKLTALVYSGAPPRERHVTGGPVLWSLETDAEGRHVYAGGRDGKLYVLDVRTGALVARTGHTDGIPGMSRSGDLLATASDDKTVGIWRLPEAALVRRTTAHAFLVNDLRFSEDGRTAVTSSSDGTVKTWRWPEMEPTGTIDVAEAAGEKVSLHALHLEPRGERMLVGSWNGAMFRLERLRGSWKATRIAVRSRALYRFAALPALDLVGAVGLYPHAVYLVDPRSGDFRELPSGDLPVYWCVADARGAAFTVVGEGGINRYEFAREAEGAIRWTLRSRRQSGADLLSVAPAGDGGLWAATQQGEILRFGADVLAGAPLLSGSLPGFAPR